MYNNDRLLKITSLLFNVLLNYMFIAVAIKIFDLYYLKSLQADGSVSSELNRYWSIKSSVTYYCAMFNSYIPCLIFIAWFYREYWNTQYIFYQYEFKYKPITAILAFIIPIFNFFAPYIIMVEIIEGHNYYYNKSINFNHVKIWWLGTVVYLLYSKTISLCFTNEVNEYIIFTYHSIIADCIGMLALAYLVSLLKQINTSKVRT